MTLVVVLKWLATRKIHPPPTSQPTAPESSTADQKLTPTVQNSPVGDSGLKNPETSVSSNTESSTNCDPSLPPQNPVRTDANLSPSASTSLAAKCPPIPPGGLPIPVNKDVVLVPAPTPSGIWKVFDPNLANINSASLSQNKVVSADVPQIYESILNLLMRRREGEDLPATPPVQMMEEPFGYKPALALRDWFNKKPSKLPSFDHIFCHVF